MSSANVKRDEDGQLPVIRMWVDSKHALWDEHPGELVSRVDSPNGRDQERPLSAIRDKHGPLIVVWHRPDACPPGCDLPGADATRRSDAPERTRSG